MVFFSISLSQDQPRSTFSHMQYRIDALRPQRKIDKWRIMRENLANKSTSLLNLSNKSVERAWDLNNDTGEGVDI
ncbi:hypothetical protein I7I50_04434 [Histoplasma capsulatum G186AR]|uniref:Uncharacterized protein n=1 Tax=Ajellomyces capsulatus TaxID=5037 RepID=A0A8H7YMM5_AJECA|nr:hypothetical protein I7I52_05342 [Histoplasma capsulatum]QSS75328.1 hypothetical protein I7I50_04434 [Histoplasma capsulatum G186AR]